MRELNLTQMEVVSGGRLRAHDLREDMKRAEKRNYDDESGGGGGGGYCSGADDWHSTGFGEDRTLGHIDLDGDGVDEENVVVDLATGEAFAIAHLGSGFAFAYPLTAGGGVTQNASSGINIGASAQGYLTIGTSSGQGISYSFDTSQGIRVSNVHASPPSSGGQ